MGASPRRASDGHATHMQASIHLLRKLCKPIGPLLLRPAEASTSAVVDCEKDTDRKLESFGRQEIVQSPRTSEDPSTPSTILDRHLFSMSPSMRRPTLLPLYVQGHHALPAPLVDESSLEDSSSISRGGHVRSETVDTVVAPSTPTGEPKGSDIEKFDPKSQKGRPGLSEEVADLVAVTSEEYERYERNQKTDKHFWDDFKIDPMERDFSRTEPENEWTLHVHPEGFLYFHNDRWEIPVLTDVYVYNKRSLEDLERYIDDIFRYIRRYDLDLPSDVCLVLEFRSSGRCGYYFVDHAAQCLFWLDEFDAAFFLSPVRVNYTPSLIYHEMKALYWLHNEYFPDMRPFPDGAVLELKDILLDAIGDTLTSSFSTAPYDLETLKQMLEVVEKIEELKSAGPKSVRIICRLLYNFYHEKFLQLHGEQYARLNADQSIHPERPQTWLIKLISPFLLYGPEVYLRKLKEISVDSLVKQHHWSNFLKKVTDEWKEFTLYATVLLNANVAFLAIQSVDSSAPPRGRSAMQRASYFSIVTSIGAIILGLLLVRQHNTTLSASFLVRISTSVLGLETLALVYSLPYALLLWGFVSFLLAFSLMCFGSHDVLTIVMITISGAVLLSLLVWSLSVSVEGLPFWYPWPPGKLQSFLAPEGFRAGSGRMRPTSDPTKHILSKSESESMAAEKPMP